MAKDIKFNIIDDNFRILSLCLYFCGRVGIVLAFQAVHSHPPATGYLTTLSQYAQQVVLFIFIPSAYKSKLLTLPDKNKAGLCPAYCFCCDPVGNRTYID